MTEDENMQQYVEPLSVHKLQNYDTLVDWKYVQW
jgi:hypothetical protein